MELAYSESGEDEGFMIGRTMLPGESAGDYSKEWWKTFDVVFLIGWVLGAFVLGIVTYRELPEFFQDYRFIIFACMKLALMALMAVAGGLVCRHFCQMDQEGYIITNKDSWFKVNYIRKLQHFAAYLVPMWTPSFWTWLTTDHF